ncbi:hypothetical protein FJY94_02735 [Candidatus Kaiserbacteria bacterium]|nr:hypothetical protein [Candidatus Kaiserbacteria bacterium]
MRPEPYIGATGFKNPDQVECVLAATAAVRQKIMIGVLVSSKTLNGIPNKYPGISPAMRDVASIFPPGNRTLNLVHYSTDDTRALGLELQRAREFGGENCQGVQLNIPWPSTRTVEAYQRRWDTDIIVLQLGKQAMKEADNEPSRIAESLRAYEGLIDYALIDASGGFGVPLVLDSTRRLLEVLYRLDWLHIGIAGGQCADTIDEVAPLFREFPGTSIDAQGKLQTNGVLNVENTIAYVTKASTMLFRQTQGCGCS